MPGAGDPTALTCAKGGTCKVGDVGRGGGIVFYDAGTTKSWGRYLEAAIADVKVPVVISPPSEDEDSPHGQNDGRPQWGCYVDAIFFGPGAKTEIGSGLANTKKITDSNCKGTDNSVSAASLAATDNGGGKTDWFLPSRDELNELCKYARTQTTGDTTKKCDSLQTLRRGFAADYYWSSSEGNAVSAWVQYFLYEFQFTNYKDATAYVRPVRAF
jgi:hypothetical protein